MDAVTFAVGGHTYSYGGFYLGLGLFVTAFMLFAAALAWKIGAMARRASPDVRFLGGLLTMFMLVSLALALRYFSAMPATLSALIVLTTGAATFFSAGSPSSSC